MAIDPGSRTLLPWLRWGGTGLAAGAAVASVLAATSSGLAAYYARMIVIPNRRREDLEILAVAGAPGERRVVLPANAETTVPGRYALYVDGGAHRALIGEILSLDGSTVTRAVTGGDETALAGAVRGWWSGDIIAEPAELGLDHEDVQVGTPAGLAPAWRIDPADPGAPEAATWVIGIHGRGARRSETLRGAAVMHRLGYTMLAISYRNDGEAPRADGGRYGLGGTEWRDVDAAIGFALDHGAERIVLLGYSMGGAVALQTVDQSSRADRIAALVLDAPVVNWTDVLGYQARLNRVPDSIGQFSQLMISHPAGRAVTGLAAPVDLKSMDWVSRADHLRTPTLIVHSVDDDFVPAGPSEELARRNPEFVSFVPFERARHTKEWNVDPERWEAVVADWLPTALRAATPAPG
ncbi:alpha/beta hydrolase [Tersicoccus solisilvae]|uniref:Alpha/beta hydrolase n=1 Tax=Tersicoccus solisilvae TaxID=1882339 RepID=A0ABQ1PNK3_9MICC|nr:alpha/beta fold hydrolase [Tersicoccus solisilvae]GGD00170.1 alpha/beta hydrolase [Tersicoccus solisilvae]